MHLLRYVLFCLCVSFGFTVPGWAQNSEVAFPVELQGQNLFELANRISAFGPRPTSSANAQRLAHFIQERLAATGLEVHAEHYPLPAGDWLQGATLQVGELSVPVTYVASSKRLATEMSGTVVLVGNPKLTDPEFARNSIVLLDKPVELGQRAQVPKQAATTQALVAVNNVALPKLLSRLNSPHATQQATLKLQPLVAESTSGTNILAVLPGATLARIIIGCHYDTIPGSPGGNDNASGVATIIQLAQAAARLSWQHTLEFVAFDGEETGLSGSHAYVQQHAANLHNVHAVLVVDTVGKGTNLIAGTSTEAGLFKTAGMLIPILLQHTWRMVTSAFSGRKASGSSQANLRVWRLPPSSPQSATKPKVAPVAPAWYTTIGRKAAASLHIQPGYLPGGGSDHIPFLQAGIPAGVVGYATGDGKLHSAHDDALHLEPQKLEQAASLVWQMLLLLDAENASTTRVLGK